MDIVYITAPNKVKPLEGEEDSDQRGWWFSARDETFVAQEQSEVHPGYEDSLDVIAKAFSEQGPFDGVMAFSQGAAFAAMICALQQSGDTRFSFSFVIIVAGFCSRSSGHAVLYKTPITLPSLHVFGDTDRVIQKDMSEELLTYFKDPKTIEHTGGHFVPTSAPQKKLYIAFLDPWLQEIRNR
ncbi:esterase OVCA2-like isoform X1 [Amphiura filiformis]|uniref:esterase OVCA2-like isoform X1 n=1 Tax=Amphiura filiformis TaxID=82378 RepID=UPI003B213BD3